MVSIGYGIKSPQTGLVPVGNNFYSTPNTPADPTDCNRYPNSVYCGGGFSPRSISLLVTPVVDNCNIGIEVDGSLGFIALPSFQFVYRFPNCRLGEPQQADPIISGQSTISIPATPDCDNPLGFAYVKRNEFSEQALVSAGLATFSFVETTQVAHIYYPVVFSNEEVKHEIGAVIVLNVVKEVKYNMPWLETFGGYTLGLPLEQQQDTTFTFNKTYNVWSQSNDVSKRAYGDYTDYWLYHADGTDNNGTAIVTYGTGINDWHESGIRTISGGPYIDNYNRAINLNSIYYGVHSLVLWDVILTCEDYAPAIPKYAPPPPKKKKCCEEDDMACCPDNSDLLKAILAKLNTLSQIVGVADYPASLPKSFITKNGKNPGNVSIPSLTQLLGWYIQRFDEIMGQFEIDLDVAKPDGNGETIPVRLPNMAEAIAEMMTLMFQASINSELLVNICNRTLIEAGQNKQQEFKNHMAINSIIEYLGFGVNETSETMPLTFKPGETSFSKMLVETEISVKGTQFDGKQGLHAALIDLLQAAAIIRAVHWRKFDQTKDVAAQLFNTILAAKVVKDELFTHDDCLDFDIDQLIQDTIKPTAKKNPDTVTPKTVNPSTGQTGG